MVRKSKTTKKVEQLNLFNTSNDEQYGDVFCRIRRMRRQILVHSIIYYRFSDNLIDDFKYDKIARELVKLQAENPEISEKVSDFIDDFRDFGKDGCYSGYNLKGTTDVNMIRIAKRTLDYAHKLKGK